MILNQADREEVVKNSLDNAKRIYAEIPILIENKLYGTAAGRLYYACYHAVSALLVNDNLVATTHNGKIALLNQQYVDKGKFEKSISVAFSQMGSFRDMNDYGDWTKIKEEKVISLIEPAGNLINSIEKLILEAQQNEQISQAQKKTPEVAESVIKEEIPKTIDINGITYPNPKHPDNKKNGMKI